MKNTINFLTVLVIVFFLYSCKKNKASCYSWQLERQSKNKYCTTDCPTVIGCDGKTYCNACEANKKGLKVK